MSGVGMAPSGAQPVNRSRRAHLVAGLVATCLALTSGAVFGGYEGPLVDLYVNGLIGLMTAVSLTYLTGSVIDYNGGVLPTLRGRASYQPPVQASSYAPPGEAVG